MKKWNKELNKFEDENNEAEKLHLKLKAAKIPHIFDGETVYIEEGHETEAEIELKK